MPATTLEFQRSYTKLIAGFLMKWIHRPLNIHDIETLKNIPGSIYSQIISVMTQAYVAKGLAIEARTGLNLFRSILSRIINSDEYIESHQPRAESEAPRIEKDTDRATDALAKQDDSLEVQLQALDAEQVRVIAELHTLLIKQIGEWAVLQAKHVGQIMDLLLNSDLDIKDGDALRNLLQTTLDLRLPLAALGLSDGSDALPALLTHALTQFFKEQDGEAPEASIKAFMKQRDVKSCLKGCHNEDGAMKKAHTEATEPLERQLHNLQTRRQDLIKEIGELSETAQSLSYQAYKSSFDPESQPPSSGPPTPKAQA